MIHDNEHTDKWKCMAKIAKFHKACFQGARVLLRGAKLPC